MIKMDINQATDGLILSPCSPETELQMEAATKVIVINKDVIVQAASYLNFPTVGKVNAIYIDSTANKSYRWDGYNLNYYIIGSDYNDIKIIDGGTAATE